MRWASIQNGQLLQQAEVCGFEVLITTDQNLKYQQNLSERVIGIVVLGSTSWPRIQRVLAEVRAAIEQIRVNDYIEVSVPHDR